MNLLVITPSWPDSVSAASTMRVKALTTTRCGGASRKAYRFANFSLSGSDNPCSVAANRSQLLQQFGLSQIQWLSQSHSAHVLRVVTAVDPPPPADGAITSTSCLACAVTTADCLPLFLCDVLGTEVAMIHCGWRGLLQGIIAQIVSAFMRPAHQLMAAFGPTISAQHYLVKRVLRDRFIRVDAALEHCFVAQDAQHCYADLPAIAAHQLRKLGVRRIGGVPLCTFANAAQFYSWRRDAVPKLGMASLIWLEPI